MTNSPILLSEPTILSYNLTEFLKDKNYSKIITLGSNLVTPESILSKLKK